MSEGFSKTYFYEANTSLNITLVFLFFEEYTLVCTYFTVEKEKVGTKIIIVDSL